MSRASDCIEKISSKGYKNRDGSPVLTPEDFQRVSSATDPVAEVLKMMDGGTRYSAADPFEQNMGERNVGAGKPARSKVRSVETAKAVFFDGSQPVTRENTLKAVQLAQEWNDPAMAPDLVQRLLDANEGDALIIGTAQGELYRYALKLAAKGQNHLLDFFQLTSNSWGVVGRNENIGVSEAATILAGRRDYSQSSALDAAKKVDGAREEAEAKTLPPETSKAITAVVTSTKLDKPTVRKVGSNVKDKEGETLEEKVEKNVADVTAQSLLERFATSQSDTLSWAPKGQENKIRALVRAALTIGPKAKMWDRVWLIESLVALDVTPELAAQLTETVWAERKRLTGIRQARAAEQAAAKEKRDAERKAKRDAAAAAATAAENEDVATAVIDQLATLQSDTPTNKPKPEVNAVRALVKQALDPAAMWTQPMLVEALGKLNVSQETAVKLTAIVWAQRQKNGAAIIAKKEEQDREAAEALAEGTMGSLRGLEDALLAAPASQQQDPVWRLQAATEYFTQLGLSPQRAAAAARAYSMEFGARLGDALANAIERVASTSAPWQEKLKGVGETRRKKLLTDMDKLLRAVRAGVTNPDTHWYNVVARQNGWRGFTAAQHVRMGEIDDALQDPTVADYKKKAYKSEIQDIISAAGLSPTLGAYVSASYAMSSLSGLPTDFVQFSSPVSIFRDFLTDLPFNPVVATRSLIAAMESLVMEGTYAAKNDVYNHEIHENLREEVPALKDLFERGLKNWQSPNLATRAKGALQWAVGLQQFVSRMLGAIDEGALAASNIYKLSIFSNRELRRLGLSRNFAGQVVLAALETRHNNVVLNMANGMSRSEAVVAANETFRRNVHAGVANENKQSADDVLLGSVMEGVGMVGRRSQKGDVFGVQTNRVEDTEEGFLRKAVFIPQLLEWLSKQRANKNWNSLFAMMMFGFPVVAIRAAMWGSNFFGYGLIRSAIHHGLKKAGKETFWKQSFATRAQERQRLREAIISLVVMGASELLRSNSGDDDDDKPFKFYVTGKGPENQALKDAWIKKGFKPYALIFEANGYKLPVNLGRLGESLAWTFAFGGALDDAHWREKERGARGKKDAFPTPLELGASYFGALAQRSAFQGLGRNLGAFDSRKTSSQIADELTKQGAFALSGLAPWKAASNSVARLLTTPVDNNSVKGIILSNTPVVGPMFGKPALNVFSDPIGDQTISGKLYREGFPFIMRFPQNDRVYELVLEQGRGPSDPRRSDMARTYGDMTPEQFYQFTEARGKAIKAAMNERYDKLRAMDPKQFGSALTSITREANRKAAQVVGLKKVTAP